MIQLGLFDEVRREPRDLPPISRPRFHGQVALMWHGLHPERTAWYWWDSKDTVWRCIDPFDQHGINYLEEPPVVNDCGRLVEKGKS